MCKKLVSFLMSLCLLLTMVLPVYAAETEEPETRRITIINLKNFEKLVENCRLDSYSRNLVVSLETDLDLAGRDFAGIPIFCGRFEGNGHTIRGLKLTGEGSTQGFFRYLTDTAMVVDLHLEGIVQPAGSASQVGGIAGKNSGLIRNCSFSGTVSGKEFIGGIAGVSTVSGTVEDCRISGSVFGSHFVGGIAGKNVGVIRGCENHANINETPQQNTVELTDITLNSLLQSEAASTVTDVGGIAGISSGLIRDCRNHATVGHRSMGYNIGGIAGTQSGTIIACENQGEIFGRKEVGGIAGQMEPSAVMEFEEDVLQILKRQLDGMGQTLNAASSNLQGAGQVATSQLGILQDYMADAKHAVSSLIPDEKLPDMDSIIAARNTIGNSMVGMSRVMDNMGSAAYSALGAVSTNLYTLNDQINAMRTTLGNVSETLGGSIVDRSDEDTELDFSGKVADCRNFGNIYGDLNSGGIAGAMAMENDLDMQEDWQLTGSNSLNFESEIRAVILNCENDAQVTVGKQNAGGIVGYQSMGLVKNSRNYGKLDAANADYVGGIAGRSQGYIRSSHANSEILGSNYVGGIAGAASIVTGCYGLTRIHGSLEKSGAILGFREENETDEENPVAGNYYLPIEGDPGAIDGISYDTMAQPMQEEGFFLLEGLPERFSQAVVTFRYGNGNQRKFTVEIGSVFPVEWVPQIPPKEGRRAYWDGLDAIANQGIFFDMVFEQAYTTQMDILESPVTRGEIPLLFVQGVFSVDAALTVRASDAVFDPGNGRVLEVWDFTVTEPENQERIRLLLPEGTEPEAVSLFVRDISGTWRKETHHLSGRYAVAGLQPGDDAVALVQEKEFPWTMAVVILAVLAVGGYSLFHCRKKKPTP